MAPNWKDEELRHDEVMKARKQREACARTTFEDEYTGEKPKQYSVGIDTFKRADANLSAEGNLAVCVFMIDKYIWRDKGSDLDDFYKARDYINRAIKIMEESIKRLEKDVI